MENKQKLLAKLKNKNEMLMQIRTGLDESLDSYSNERDFLKVLWVFSSHHVKKNFFSPSSRIIFKSLNDANDQQLEQENHLLKIIKIEKARALADATETEQELARIKSRIKSLTNIYNSQKHLYDDLQRNG